MSCPFATGIYLLRCGATAYPYIPTSREFNDYCADDKYEQYRICAHYRTAVWSGLAAAPPPGCARLRKDVG